MGVLRSPHEATCPSIASRFLLRGRSHVILHHDISRQAFTTDRHGAYAGVDRRSYRRGFRRRPAAVMCMGGAQLAQGTAAWLRHANVAAETLEGGFEGWKEAKLPLVNASKLPPRDAQGRTVWVTRARPKIDRIACPWLIRRFVDPTAVFLFVAPSEVVAVGERFNAAPFDVENVFWSHRGELCTFDVMIEEFGLASGPLSRLGKLVRGADTGRLGPSPGGTGPAAASAG